MYPAWYICTPNTHNAEAGGRLDGGQHRHHHDQPADVKVTVKRVRQSGLGRFYGVAAFNE